MSWKLKKHTKDTKGKVEIFVYQFFMNFNVSTWNKKEIRPVIEFTLRDYKQDEKNTWSGNVFKKNKRCEVRFSYFQNHPLINFSSQNEFDNNHPNYELFNIEYCKQISLDFFENRLSSVLGQIVKKEILIEKI
jgi:hypothetical protein